ncbi:MAG: hypothetical protein ACRCYS_17200, partial [Beijerinckiaceae bacterium]
MITSLRFALTLLALALAAYALYSLISNEIPAANRDALMVALGVILGLSKDAFGFFFSSSQSSSEKNKLIAGTASGKEGDPVHVTPEL